MTVTPDGALAARLLAHLWADPPAAAALEPLLGSRPAALERARQMATLITLDSPDDVTDAADRGLQDPAATRPAPGPRLALHWSLPDPVTPRLLYLGTPDWRHVPAPDGDLRLRITADTWAPRPFDREAAVLDLRREDGRWTLTRPEPTAEPRTAAPLPEADLVVQGGLTGGVVYPRAIAELSRSFRLRRVGGTSAGAIAAALAAAAEYRRQTGGGPAGFRQVNELAGDLSTPDAAGQTLLRRLFQPQPGTAPLFRLLLAALDQQRWSRMAGVLARDHLLLVVSLLLGAALLALGGLLAPLLLVAALALRLWRARPVWAAFLLALLISLAALPFNAGWRAATPGLLPLALRLGVAAWPLNFSGLLLLLTGAAGLLSRLGLDLLVALRRNDHGLCSGWLDPGQAPLATPPLTGWLSEELDRVAGLDPAHDPPLTFGQLRWPAGRPGPDGAAPEDPQDWALDLRVFTTCVGLGRPYTLPLDTPLFGLLEQDLRRFFPARVAEAVEAHSPEVRLLGGQRLIGLPAAEALPVVVAVRLSLSFPVLFSALPLRLMTSGELAYFSDGGLTSNFPMSLFDEPVPGRPVLGLNLTYQHQPGPPPAGSQSGSVHLYDPARPAPLPVQPAASTPAFLAAIFETTRLWYDRLGLHTPGIQERLARVELYPGDGGLNLTMPPAVIDRLAERGRLAGQALAQRFATPGHPLGFEYHQGVRAALLAANLRYLQPPSLPWRSAQWEQGARSITDQPLNVVADLNGLSWLHFVSRERGRIPSLRFRPIFSR